MLLVHCDDLITVEDLIHLNLNVNPPLLAYLSACSTSNTKVDGLVDEGVHLAASFLATGFQNVIAALWQVGDSDSTDISNEFHRELVNSRLTVESIPLALHHAQRNLRWMEKLPPDEKSMGFVRQKRDILCSHRLSVWICYNYVVALF